MPGVKCHEIMRQSSCDNVWLSGADWVWERVGVSHGGDIPLWHAGTLSFGIVALQVLRVHRLTGRKSTRGGGKSDVWLHPDRTHTLRHAFSSSASLPLS